MTAISVKQFGGIKPIVSARLLGASEAQVAENARLVSGSLLPMRGTTTLQALQSSAPATIYRYGTSATETNYWLEFAQDTDVMRSPIAQDQYDRLYWTDGSNVPRYAPNSLILQAGSGAYPRASYQLGIPEPSAPSVTSTTAVTNAQTFKITATQIAALGSSTVLKISVTSSSTTAETILTIASVTAENVASSLSTVTGLSAVVSGYDVVVTPDETVNKVLASYKTGTESNYDATLVTYTPYLKTGDGAYGLVIASTQIAALGTSTTLNVSITVGGVNATSSLGVNNVSADGVAKALSTVSGLYAFVDGADVIVTVPTGTSTLTITDSNGATVCQTTFLPSSTDLGRGLAQLDNTDPSNPVIRGVSSGLFQLERLPASVLFDPATIAAIAPNTRIALTVNGGQQVSVTVAAGTGTYPPAVTARSLADALATITDVRTEIREFSTYTVSGTTTTGTHLVVSTKKYGSSATLLIRKINPVQTNVYSSQATWTSSTDASVTETRVYVCTYVSAYGEEGPPSSASSLVSVTQGGECALSLPGPPIGSYNITTKRIYRSSTVGSSAQFQFVNEVPVAQTTYSDTKTQAELGEVLPSEDWVAPPAGLKGLRLMANGAAVGFVGKTLYFSEPNLPHAWPHQYPIDYEIVGIATYGQYVAVLTTSYPYLFSGVDPAAMSSSRLPLPQACVSKRSIVETGNGVIYASPDGLVEIGTRNDVITSGLLNRDQWQAYAPATIQSYTYNGRIHCFYDNGARGALVFDFTGQGATMTTNTTNATSAVTAGFYDATSDKLYLAQGTNIVRFDAGYGLPYAWKSKVFRLDYPHNFGFAQVNAYQYPVTIKVYADGVLRAAKVVQNNNQFRLPSGFRAYEWSFQLEGTGEVIEVAIADSTAELKSV